ncbi:hypothetical protein [Caballeronia sp. LZ034LL]|uniref:hypothetical protein n=1 Tax=Caballeronia sp. LZ034LL TaxID=3038567 RepID=UPI002857718A|nr:hypothetical protein [Caballeronia sp. LZ034LL]MDR5835371.1 hypothetical protein [Caballeronia sp. LZ034LL]
MNSPLTARDRVAASLQLRYAVTPYLQLPTWTPIMASLLMSGIHPSQSCAEIPHGGVGLDGAVFQSGGNERFHDARQLLKAWHQSVEDGIAPPAESLEPFKYLVWCEEQIVEEGLRVDRKWVDFLMEVYYGPTPQPTTLMSPDVAEYSRSVESGALALIENLRVIPISQGRDQTPTRYGVAERDFLTTQEFADGVGVKPQTILKRYSETGSFYGVTPMPSELRTHAWPLDAVKRVIKDRKKN